jgi:hypothetical protein
VEGREGKADKELKDLASGESPLDGLGDTDSKGRDCVVRVLRMVSESRRFPWGIVQTIRA